MCYDPLRFSLSFSDLFTHTFKFCLFINTGVGVVGIADFWAHTLKFCLFKNTRGVAKKRPWRRTTVAQSTAQSRWTVNRAAREAANDCGSRRVKRNYVEGGEGGLGFFIRT